MVTIEGTLFGVSQEKFSITGGTTFELTVETTYPVTLTVDDSTNASSPVQLTPGAHVVSVPPLVQIDNSTRLRFEHWDDGSIQPNRTLNIQSDTTIAATFAPQYLLTLNSYPANATGAGWYDKGSSAEFSITSSVPMPGLLGEMGASLTFKGWYEKGNRVTAAEMGTVNMFQGHTLIAQWIPDFTVPIVTVAAIAAIVVAVAVFVIRRKTTRKRKKQRKRRRTTKEAKRRVTG
jgi:hypothetical protein